VFQYVSLPGVSFDIFLKTSKVRIEKITDIHVLRFAENAIRGGLAYCATRYAKGEEDSAQLGDHIALMDANNLYGGVLHIHIHLLLLLLLYCTVISAFSRSVAAASHRRVRISHARGDRRHRLEGANYRSAVRLLCGMRRKLYYCCCCCCCCSCCCTTCFSLNTRPSYTELTLTFLSRLKGGSSTTTTSPPTPSSASCSTRARPATARRS